MSTIDQRDFQVVQLVYRFKQLTANHIHELLFSDTQSKHPCYRTLDRLYRRQYLHRLEHRLIGGARGGSGTYCWSIGPAGWRLLTDAPYRRVRTISFHTLEIANTFLELVRLQRAGQFTIDSYTTEPDCWLTIQGREVHPDLYVDIKQPSGQLLTSFCEIDMGTESERRIRAKLSDYVYAFNNVDAAEFPIWPRTVWIAVDGLRATQLRRTIGQLPEDERQLFKVCERSDIAEMFS